MWRISVETRGTRVTTTEHLEGTLRTLPLLTAGAALLSATSLPAQESTRYQSFDLSRAMIRDFTVYQPFRVTGTVALREALAEGTLRPETQVAILERNGWHLAFVMAQLLYHHAAQGKRNGEPWLVSF